MPIETFSKALKYRRGGFEKWCYDKIKTLVNKTDNSAINERLAALEAEVYSIDTYTINGTVKCGDEKIANAEISFTNVNNNTKTYQGVTNSDGKYSIANIPTGLYKVTATAEGYIEYHRESNKQIKKNDTLDIPMDLE